MPPKKNKEMQKQAHDQKQAIIRKLGLDTEEAAVFKFNPTLENSYDVTVNGDQRKLLKEADERGIDKLTNDKLGKFCALLTCIKYEKRKLSLKDSDDEDSDDEDSSDESSEGSLNPKVKKASKAPTKVKEVPILANPKETPVQKSGRAASAKRITSSTNQLDLDNQAPSKKPRPTPHSMLQQPQAENEAEADAEAPTKPHLKQRTGFKDNNEGDKDNKSKESASVPFGHAANTTGAGGFPLGNGSPFGLVKPAGTLPLVNASSFGPVNPAGIVPLRPAYGISDVARAGVSPGKYRLTGAVTPGSAPVHQVAAFSSVEEITSHMASTNTAFIKFIHRQNDRLQKSELQLEEERKRSANLEVQLDTKTTEGATTANELKRVKEQNKVLTEQLQQVTAERDRLSHHVATNMAQAGEVLKNLQGNGGEVDTGEKPNPVA